MAGLKSLGLAGARNALRKLFRRPSPAASNSASAVAAETESSTSKHEANEPESAPSSAPAPAHTAVNSNSAHTGEDTATSAGTGTRAEADTNTDTDAGADADTDAAMAVDINRIISPAKPAPTMDVQRLVGKENQQPGIDEITAALGKLGFCAGGGGDGQNSVPLAAQLPDLEDPAVRAERAQHLRFIGEALDMARLALKTNETPVGCVLVHDGKVIARGMNATNVTRNGTRHAEFMALSALLSYAPETGPKTTCLPPNKPPRTAQSDGASDVDSVDSRGPPDEGNEDGSKGHLYPYGQKLHPDRKVNRAIVRESILYVTVEPCVMCASLLRQLQIKKVYFGAVNDKFGGTGGVFSIHANSLPVSEDGQTASAHPTPKPVQLPDGSGVLGTSFPVGGGDGGNVEHGYEIEGGWGRDEAVGLLRRFYVQENGRAPVPRKKEGRAARLAALLEQDGNVSSASLVTELTPGGDVDGSADRKENVNPASTKSKEANGELVEDDALY